MGCGVSRGGKPPVVLTRFIRTVQRMVPGERIEETYDEGDLVGNGTWTFDQSGNVTTAAFRCDVTAQALSMKLAFSTSGSLGHNVIYGRILAALKNKCEGRA